MTKVIKLSGTAFTLTMQEKAIEDMFKRQWVNGNVEKYMQSVKRRVKEMYGHNLEFTNESEFFNELKKYGLIEIIDKA